MSNLKVGDVVSLKSGGPSMTVSIIGKGVVETGWFDFNHILHSGTFPNEALDVLEDDEDEEEEEEDDDRDSPEKP